jgi:hypothetical protein
VRAWLSDTLSVATLALHLGCEVARSGLGRIGESAARWAHRLAVAIDPDRAPCAECGLPGGTHYDCDEPAVGLMTATERRRAFGDASEGAT